MTIIASFLVLFIYHGIRKKIVLTLPFSILTCFSHIATASGTLLRTCVIELFYLQVKLVHRPVMRLADELLCV